MSIVKVCCAIIQKNHYILAVQRADTMSNPLKWEFPGGKIENNENHTEALIREIQEELSMQIEPLEQLITVEHDYPDFQLVMHAYLSKIIYGGPKLNEHLDLKWLSEDELLVLDWAAADIPIIHKIIGKNE